MDIVLLLTVIGFICLYKIYVNSTKRLSANLILENVYLHILIGLTLTGITSMSLDKYTEKINTSKSIIGSFILSMIGLFVVFTAGNNKGMQYAGFITFMCAVGILTHPYISILKHNGNGSRIFLSLVAIVGTLALIAYKLPNIFLGWGSYLTLGLFSLIIVETIDIIFNSNYKFYNRQKIYSWIGLGIFSGLLLYDSQRLVERAKIGEILSSKLKINDVNYPALSLSLYLDIVNLFSSLVNVSN